MTLICYLNYETVVRIIVLEDDGFYPNSTSNIWCKAGLESNILISISVQ